MENNAIKLLGVNVNAHTEQKNGLTYLSWAWAWDQVLRQDDKANFEVKEFNGLPYVQIGDTAMVWVTVTIFGKPVTCWLPVMNNKNEPISVTGRKFTDRFGKEKTERLDAFNVNTAIMRCLTKAVAMHGLGLYIYAGEDLPMDDGAPAAVPEAPAPTPVTVTAIQLENPAPVQATENLKLFADSIKEYMGTCKTTKGLQSYYIKNKDGMEKLKEAMPDLYAEVLELFTQTKAKLSQPQPEGK